MVLLDLGGKSPVLSCKTDKGRMRHLASLEEPTAAGATKEGLKMKLNGRGQKWAVKRNRLDDQ